jgi:hypothetical protein
MRRVLTIGLYALLAACGTSGPDSPPQGSVGARLQALELRSGTSFGMCGGYCVTELRIDTLGVTLTESSQAMDLPARTRTLPLSRADWTRLEEALDTAALRRLEGTHGCPDCADGGAEWIQVGRDADPVRVTFEFGAELDGIGSLQSVIRELRGRFPR